MNRPGQDLAAEQYVNLATFRRTGVEVKTPVWIAGRDDRYFVFSEANAGKVKRIRATSRVRLAACDVRGRVRGEWVEGQAQIVADPEVIAAAKRLFRAKYGLIMWISDALATLSGRMRRRAYLQIRLGDAGDLKQ